MVKKYLIKTPVEAVQFQELNEDFKKWFEDNWSYFYDIDGELGDSEVTILEEDGSEFLLRKGCWVVKDCRGAFQIIQDDMFRNNYQEYKEN